MFEQSQVDHCWTLDVPDLFKHCLLTPLLQTLQGIVAKSWLLGVNKVFAWGAPNYESWGSTWLFGHVGIVQKVKMAKTTHVLDQNTANPLWCVKFYQFVCAALTALVLLQSSNICDCVRLISISEPRMLVNVSCHTFNMTLSSNAMRDRPCLGFSVILKEVCYYVEPFARYSAWRNVLLKMVSYMRPLHQDC